MKTKFILVVAICWQSTLKLHAQTDCTNAFDLGTNIALNSTSCGINTAVMDVTITQFTGNQCGQNVVAEVWTMFTISDGSLPTYLFEAQNTSNNQPFGLQIFSGNCASLNLLACVNNDPQGGGGTPFESTVLSNLTNGTYYVRLISYNNSGWDSEICITQVSAATTNDDCATAIPVSVGADGICTEVTGTNSGATASSGVSAPSCSSYAGGDVWFSVVVPASGNITFATDYAANNSLTDIGMAIYGGTCGSLSEIDCDDDGGNGLMSSISATGLTPGATVYVRVWEYGNNEVGEFDLCFSEPSPSADNQDCSSAQGLCTDATLNGASNGSGNIADLNATNEGCLYGENESSWYYIEVSTAGNFAFTISPDNGTDDYDFAVWRYAGGVGANCPPSGPPNRCSFAAGSGLNGSYDTGLMAGAGEQTEDASGDNWVNQFGTVNVGDIIVILVDNFSSTTSPFTMDFTGTAGLDCSVLSIDLLTFYAEQSTFGNRISWNTKSELNNDYFTLQHSTDGITWRTIGIIDGNGTSNETHKYSYDHQIESTGLMYYKLFQTDLDGETKTEKIISIERSDLANYIVKTVNLLGQEVNSSFSGIVIDLYSNGTSKKRFQN